MSGPVTMMLGEFAFEAIGFGYQDVQRALDAPWSEIPVGNRMDVIQWNGPKSDTATIRGVLFPVEHGGGGALEGIRDAAKSGRTLMLSSLGGRIYGNFAVQRVTEDRSRHDRSGTPRKNVYEITLRVTDDAPSGRSFAGGLNGILSLGL